MNHDQNPELVALDDAAHNSFEVPAVDEETLPHRELPLSINTTDINSVFERDVLIHESTITTTDLPEVNLLGTFYPLAQYLSNSLIVNLVQPFQLWRGDLILTVRLIAPGSSYGLYNIQALREGGTQAVGREIDGAASDSPFNSTQDLHGFLNCETKAAVVMELPWVHADHSFEIGGSAQGTPWRLLLWSLAPIQTTINTTNVVGRIQIFARAKKGYSLSNLKYHSIEMKPSKIASTVAAGLSAASSVPVLAPLTAPASAVAGGISSILEYFGYTRDAEPQRPEPFIQRLTSSVANVDTGDTGEVVSLFQTNCVTVDPALGGGDGEDILSNTSFFSRWTIVDTLSVTNVDEGWISQMYVSPFYSQVVLGTHYFTTAGYAGLPFSQWRGCMEYKIVIPSSTNIQGSLQIGWSPDASVDTSTFGEFTHKLSNTVIDLAGSSETILKVGYASYKPSLYSCVGDASSVYGNSEASKYFNGTLVFKILAPLTAPRNDTNYSVKIIVMARACDDMEFGAPTSFPLYMSAVGVTAHSLQNIRYQSAVHTLAEPVESFDPSKILWGESFGSLRVMLQRFSYVHTLTGIHSQYDDALYPLLHPPPDDLGLGYFSSTVPAGDPEFTNIGWYSMPFTGIRGGGRYKFLPADGTAAAPTSITAYSIGRFDQYQEDNGFYSGVGQTGACDVQPLGVTHGAEFSFPYYGAKNFIRTRFVPDLASTIGEDLRMVGFAFPGNLVAGDHYVYTAGSHDVSAVGFRRIPGVRLGTGIVP